jgi:hypothetical protein
LSVASPYSCFHFSCSCWLICCKISYLYNLSFRSSHNSISCYACTSTWYLWRYVDHLSYVNLSVFSSDANMWMVDQIAETKTAICSRSVLRRSFSQSVIRMNVISICKTNFLRWKGHKVLESLVLGVEWQPHKCRKSRGSTKQRFHVERLSAL